jgi:hypothetical protein
VTPQQRISFRARIKRVLDGEYDPSEKFVLEDELVRRGYSLNEVKEMDFEELLARTIVIDEVTKFENKLYEKEMKKNTPLPGELRGRPRV